ncbi:MAG: RNA polymerase sigma factor [Polyangiaceae bacterium]|nr:RNA polymerase sigma factor [Polyangiaceae bacterium]
MTATATHAAITTVWKTESAKLVAVLTRIVRDVDLAEELAQDALVAALDEWPRSGVPDKPGAWLMTTAKNRAVNAVRRARMSTRKHEVLAHEAETHVPLEEIEAGLQAAMDDDVGDDVLRLVFTACHPVLSREARVALTLRLLGGLSTDEIARAFLASEPTVAQRIVRAKRTLAEARVPFEVPRGEELGARLSSVLEVVYLIFNEGYSATAGDELIRSALVGEAIRLGRVLARLAPEEPEVLSLVALMELQASRSSARTDAAGEPVLLMDQDRSLWDRALIDSGLAALESARALGGSTGPYQIQASIAACHAEARSAPDTNWKRIAALYSDLARLVPSPVVELNRAVAVSRADGPAAGLALLDALASEPALARYHLLPSARADLLLQLGRRDEARAEFERAASLTDNVRQRERLRERARQCGGVPV